MKKNEKFLTLLLLLMGISLFSACSDDKDEPEISYNKISTYTVYVNLGLNQISGGIQSKTNITIFEYNDKDEMVNYQNWENVSDGYTKRFTANKLSKKVTVLFEIIAHSGTTTATLKKYSAQVYYLQEGANTSITLDGSTRVINYSPI